MHEGHKDLAIPELRSDAIRQGLARRSRAAHCMCLITTAIFLKPLFDKEGLGEIYLSSTVINAREKTSTGTIEIMFFHFNGPTGVN